MRYLLVLLCAGSTCAPVVTTPVLDGGAAFDCQKADKHLNDLAAAFPDDPLCQKLVKTPAGKKFVNACLEIEGAGVSLNTKCLVGAATCKAADECSSR